MPFFRRPDYTSEFTQFLEKYKTEHPGLEARQREGRALLWDKNVDRQQALDDLESRVPQRGYAYSSPAPDKKLDDNTAS